MTIVMEVVDGIKLVADGIENIRKIHDAIKDGKQYFESRHPDVKSDLAAMCTEMRNTLQAIATASAIITHFRFTVGSTASESGLTLFNESLMQHKTHASDVTCQLNSLRGHCHVIRGHAEELECRAQKAGLAGLLKFFGFSSEERELQLAEALNQIYDDEMQISNNVYVMSRTLQAALEDVQQKLGPPGIMDPANVPQAASALGEYAEAFSRLEANASYAALQLQELINDLS